MKIIEYKKANKFENGFFYKILYESYADLIKSTPEYAEKYRTEWKSFDNDIFKYHDSIGKCVLVSLLDNNPIGFVSWDPRKIPDEGEIGQNCIIPRYRGYGYGKTQIQKVIKIFRAASTRIIKVKTSNNLFFIPAQKMYLASGFKEVSRNYINEYGGFELIHYEMRLNKSI